MGSLIFSFIIGILEKFFASKLAAHLENYHQQKIVEGKKDDRNLQNAAFSAAPGASDDWLHQSH